MKDLKDNVMKRACVILFCVVSFFCFATSAFAIHAEIPSETQAAVSIGETQITLGGDIRVRGEMRNNTTDFDSSKADHYSAIDQRVRLSLEAKVTPNTKGYVQLESTNENTGSTDPAINIWGNYDAKGNVTYATGTFQAGNAKHSALGIRQAWLQYSGAGLLGFDSGVKVGHMLLILGNGLFFDHTHSGDDAVLLFGEPVKNFNVTLWTAKLREGSTILNDDTSMYTALLSYRFNGDSNVSGDVTYIDDQNGFGFFGSTGTSPTHLWNFGLRGETKVSGLGIKGDVEIQTGNEDRGTGLPGLKLRGYAFLAGLSYTLEPVKLSLDYAYGSGDDNKNDDTNKTFITSLGDDQHYTYVYEYRTTTAANAIKGGIANTEYIKLGGSSQLVKDLAADVNLYYLWAPAKVAANSPYGFPATSSSSYIGTEIDGKFTYTIDKNLQYWIEGGYLFAGDFWKVITGSKEPDNAYAIRNAIMLTF